MSDEDFLKTIDDLDVMPPQEEHKEEDVNVYKDLFSGKNIDFKTELSKKEINTIVKLKSIGKELRVPILKNLVYDFMRLRVSLERKGRGEAIKINTLSSLRDMGLTPQIPSVLENYTGQDNVNNRLKRGGL